MVIPDHVKSPMPDSKIQRPGFARYGILNNRSIMCTQAANMVSLSVIY